MQVYLKVVSASIVGTSGHRPSSGLKPLEVLSYVLTPLIGLGAAQFPPFNPTRDGTHRAQPRPSLVSWEPPWVSPVFHF